ncbi:MAG: efflux RND transporter periplasmic adaptor subunit [Desulfatiglans sp.]|jgi:RND family efflux transporter MFP subunit|nr:efflux RND transporter periplasmic adaptor subunit [Desulfatiglans sp.]
MSQLKPDMKIKILKFMWVYFPWMLVILLLIIGGCTGAMLASKKQRLDYEKKNAIKEESPAVKVVALHIEPREFKDRINLPATIESDENLWVKSEVSGLVVQKLVDKGQFISRGQTLVKLDDRDYQLRIDSIEANYRLALIDHKRISELAEKKIAAITDLDKIDAQLKALESQLNEAKLALERTRIKAPINGRLNEIEAKVGDWLGVDKPVAQILQMGSVKVTVGIPESDVAAVFDLKEADVTIEALDNITVKGKKIFLSRNPGTMARLYNLELAVQNPDGRILPGMFARVDIVKRSFSDAIVIPLYAVITQQNERFVYIEKNGKVEKRIIELGLLSDWEIQVTKGLMPGDNVIIVGHRVLDTGQRVDIIRTVKDPREILNS